MLLYRIAFQIVLLSTPLSLLIFGVLRLKWNASHIFLSFAFHAWSITFSDAQFISWVWPDHGCVRLSLTDDFFSCARRIASWCSFFRMPRALKGFSNIILITATMDWVYSMGGFFPLGVYPLLSTKTLGCVVCKRYTWYLPYRQRTSLARWFCLRMEY